VSMMGAGLRPSGKPEDLPPYPKMQTRRISIPTFRRRVVKKSRVVKTRGVYLFWDEPAGCLMTERVAAGVERA
jgi:hypothetical protein